MAHNDSKLLSRTYYFFIVGKRSIQRCWYFSLVCFLLFACLVCTPSLVWLLRRLHFDFVCLLPIIRLLFPFWGFYRLWWSHGTQSTLYCYTTSRHRRWRVVMPASRYPIFSSFPKIPNPLESFYFFYCLSTWSTDGTFASHVSFRCVFLASSPLTSLANRSVFGSRPSCWIFLLPYFSLSFWICFYVSAPGCFVPPGRWALLIRLVQLWFSFVLQE